MPIIQGTKRYNPLDLNKNVKIGVAYPINEINLFDGTDTTKVQTKTNLLDLLLTDQGERINMPTYGIGLKNLLFESNISPEDISVAIENQINKFIPQIQVIDVQSSTEEHNLFVKIIYRFVVTQETDAVEFVIRD